MKRRAVLYSPEARDDLRALYDQIADASSAHVAIRYLGRVHTYLDGFELASERGSPRSDLRAELRTIGFERRLTIAFSVGEKEVTILRVFRAGEDWTSAV